MVTLAPELSWEAMICSQERLEAVQRHPSADEQRVTEGYRQSYRAAYGRFPHGLHYIPFPGEPETVPVWFAPQD